MPEILQEGLRSIHEQHAPLPENLRNQLPNVALVMVESANIQPGQKVLIWIDGTGMPLVEDLYNLCQERKAQITLFHRDLDRDTKECTGLTPEEIFQRFEQEQRMVENAENILIVRSMEPAGTIDTLTEDREKAYRKANVNAHQRRIEHAVPWTMTLWPTELEAQNEGMTYEEYFQLWVDACDHPWAEIKKAQKFLVEKLDKAKEIRLRANSDDPDENKRTDVTMSIDGMTFYNSTIDGNVPGSEVFSAPVLNSVNGQIYGEGLYQYQGKSMRGLHLFIENGKILETSYAEEGNENLQAILADGEGARFFGEVALGTNPGLRKRMLNALLAEKSGGTFHMAIGHCYTNAPCDGVTVQMDNGNTKDKTSIHWDVTISMNEDDGGGEVILYKEVIVDGNIVVEEEVIQRNGIFLDEELAVLNPKQKK